ncbi:retropepsin-like aspartic protease [Flavilitoribacter nigricans]|uniref:Peptidase A2 domain-containing protein n=1 Tax=Flavilitoribacter nigricans (strain ATCC 23147 / DSM 23189 / NBRC 102662 / NCIMB 1420 / SS-2) TaxID=1122177 RepID=A0A2D0NIJ3_FLAN2|nr:retropepsin-like aspartic protease [Flavilitoribacter nigricans]PHN08258.1 hypothetical protein CRP01_02745 [Flavilitoribacter nigricans DSM 23189 = NBRC 102662]
MYKEKIFWILIIWANLFSSLLANSNSSIPFRLVGKLIIIQAKVNGLTGNFILDTGISDVLLNSKYFKGKPTERVFVGVNGDSENINELLPSLQIGNHYWEIIYAEVLPITHLEKSKGIPIHGLLGTKIFGDYILLIDYPKRQIELFQMDDQGKNSNFSQMKPDLNKVEFLVKGNMPVIVAEIGKKKLSFLVDTGAEINLIDNRYAKKLSKQLLDKREPIQRISSLGKHSKKITPVKLVAIRVGNYNLKEMRIAFIRLGHFNYRVPGPPVDGILGYEFLNQLRVAFDFKKHEMHFLVTEE